MYYLLAFMQSIQTSTTNDPYGNIQTMQIISHPNGGQTCVIRSSSNNSNNINLATSSSNISGGFPNFF